MFIRPLFLQRWIDLLPEDAARGLSVRLNQVQSKREFSSTGPGKPAKRIKSE
jgi:hypothetical protein